MICLCNHLTSFGSDFIVAPNPIDFSALGSKLAVSKSQEQCRHIGGRELLKAIELNSEELLPIIFRMHPT